MPKLEETKVKKEPRAKKDPAQEREVIHKEVSAVLWMVEHGNPVDEAQAEKMLGWVEEPPRKPDEKAGPWGDKYDYATSDGIRVRLTKNQLNRAIRPHQIECLRQIILNGQWKFNGQPLSVSKYDDIISAQHRLLGLKEACIAWRAHPNKWRERWPSAPTIDALVVYGLEEDAETLATIDTGIPRDLADTFFTDRMGFFPRKPPAERQKLARTMDKAIRALRQRTGVEDDWVALPTHQEMHEFEQLHPTLRKCLAHVVEENGADGKILRYLPLGTASAVMYVMASGTSDIDEYRNPKGGGRRSERRLKWELWDKAKDFWALLAGHAKEMEAVRMADVEIGNDDVGDPMYIKAFPKVNTDADGLPLEQRAASLQERLCIISRAWDQYSTGQKITAADVELKYHDWPGNSKVLGYPTNFGGIDTGDEAGKEYVAPAEETMVSPEGVIERPETVPDDDPAAEKAKRAQVDEAAAKAKEAERKRELDAARERQKTRKNGKPKKAAPVVEEATTEAQEEPAQEV